MDEEMDMEMAAPMDAGGLDLKGLAEKLSALADMIAQLQAQLPKDAGEEAATEVDEGNAEMAEQEEAPDDKAAAKRAAAAMLAKQLG